MKKLVYLLALLFVQTTFSQTTVDKSMITTLGMGTVTAFPDAALITLSFEHLKPTLREAINENQKTVDQVKKIVEKYVSDNSDIQISMISTDKSTRWDEKLKKDVFIGFESTQKLIFTLKKLDQMQDLTEELLKTRFNKIENISYFHTDAENYIKKAEELAVLDAIETTSRLAKVSGVKTGKILLISSDKSPNDDSENSVGNYRFKAFGKGMRGRGVTSSGQLIKFVVTVNINTEILN